MRCLPSDASDSGSSTRNSSCSSSQPLLDDRLPDTSPRDSQPVSLHQATQVRLPFSVSSYANGSNAIASIYSEVERQTMRASDHPRFSSFPSAVMGTTEKEEEETVCQRALTPEGPDGVTSQVIFCNFAGVDSFLSSFFPCFNSTFTLYYRAKMTMTKML